MKQDRIARIGLPAQDSKDMTTREQNRKAKTARKGKHVRQLNQDSQNGAARMGQAEQDCKDRTNRTRLPAQGCKKRTAWARQKGEDSRKDSQNRTAR
jgi:hypothetical protein